MKLILVFFSFRLLFIIYFEPKSNWRQSHPRCRVRRTHSMKKRTPVYEINFTPQNTPCFAWTASTVFGKSSWSTRRDNDSYWPIIKQHQRLKSCNVSITQSLLVMLLTVAFLGYSQQENKIITHVVLWSLSFKNHELDGNMKNASTWAPRSEIGLDQGKLIADCFFSCVSSQLRGL